jgi:Tfp pilus assembly protein PilF
MMNGSSRCTLLALALFAAACAHRSDLSRPAVQDNFGVQMARMNLWREAMFRFQRATQMDPASAQAHNNLAVAYEANGDFEKARKEYIEALRLDRSNSYIQKNYSRFVEFLARNRKRQQAAAKVALPGATPGATTTVSGPPDRPIAATPPSGPATPPTAPPSDLPPPKPAQPQPLPVPPRGAA